MQFEEYFDSLVAKLRENFKRGTLTQRFNIFIMLPHKPFIAE